ncbi:hypothetical protein M011DRAFT_350558 [Sporormia fimetaria CBS 119925]|uniref:Zn(2)-C6 fungal-type domain-containing protein n=1 Tax=Sporormia fimetaria CBS 119925 TaxID=1340428 RepID=A0A6A6VFA7_9PLEO|nr:hypothetical protein M011DRAFT_350558 [Sporormia fimetaria CBS 119925]
MGPKRSASAIAADDAHTTNFTDDNSTAHHQHKLPKLDSSTASPAPSLPLLSQSPAGGHFAAAAVSKRRLQTGRTGQACDRCKLRKIRCDPRPEGCSPCAQNRTPCKTTDRITGKATARGHAEALEAENSYLRAHVAELQAQLRELGAEPRRAAGLNDAPPTASTASPMSPCTPAGDAESSSYRPLPHFKTDSVGDNYLGVASADSLLSHIKGTSLSVFGAEIDITDFVEGSEEDYDKSPMSYTYFVEAIFGPREHLAFPHYQELYDYATWFFRSLNPYTMLLDKPTFMRLIWRIGNEPGFIPSPADTVNVHMMLATIKYQIATRNGELKQEEEAHRHYAYSLTFVKDLMRCHTWQGIQALAMICHHMRNFPKPGAAWYMVSMTFLLAIESGLHRSVKAWAHSNRMDRLEIEMRKRIFWTLHVLKTSLSGKLGRPMSINLEDIDVEFPEPLDDFLPGEEATLTPFRRCSFQVGIQAVKYSACAAMLFRTIYAVRQSPRGYEDSVRRLDDEIRMWREAVPPELADPAKASVDNYIFALYLEFWHLEFQLLLRHPAVCRSTDPDFVDANLNKCLEISEKMLHNCMAISKIKSLDIPWINTVVYIAAIFTSLFIHYQRRDRMTLVDMTKLKNDMSQWIHVMGICGQLLRTGNKLKNAVERIVDHSLSNINDSIVKRSATESLARVALHAPQGREQPPMTYSAADTYGRYSDTHSAPVNPQLAVSESSYRDVSAGIPLSYGSATAPVTPQARLNGSYAYAAPQDHAIPFQPHYDAAPFESWQMWSRENVQQVAPVTEYLPSRPSHMPPIGREGPPAMAHVAGGAGGHTFFLSMYDWPNVQFNFNYTHGDHNQ